MKKIAIIIFWFIYATINLQAQDQTIKGNLSLQVSQTISDWGHMTTPYGSYGHKLCFGNIYDNYDPLWIARYNQGKEASELHINLGDGPDSNDKLIIGTTFDNTKEWVNQFVVTAAGYVGIGVLYPNYKLEVNGVIRAKEVKIEATNWPDYVFSKEYNLPALSEVENHINEHKHLPNIPSEAEVKEKGVDIGDLQIKLLQKIEELTLYTIQQQKQLEEQGAMIRELQSTINNNPK